MTKQLAWEEYPQTHPDDGYKPTVIFEGFHKTILNGFYQVTLS